MNKTILKSFLALALMLSVPTAIIITVPGCAMFGGGYDPGADPIVVNAQQVRQVAFDTVDTYLKFEKANRIELWRVTPEFKKVADELRVQFPLSLKVYAVTLDGYKAVRDATNRAQLEQAASSLAALGSAAQSKLTQAKVINLQ
jgi:hypothetical protein